jgi:hypothetical protein|tara:strand:+ start:695 stop:991 length:297 start_codon:yes stop_codon:yes gene_type:complete
MPKYKQVNNELIEITGSELAQLEAKEQAWIDGALDRELEALRSKRNKLLAETDYFALSDVTMSSAMTTYRQALRDLTSGLDTVEKVEAKEFPTKPSGE